MNYFCLFFFCLEKKLKGVREGHENKGVSEAEDVMSPWRKAPRGNHSALWSAVLHAHTGNAH